MSLLVKVYGSSIDYVMKNGKKIAEKGGKAVYEHVNPEGQRCLLSTKNGKPFRMITRSNQKNGTHYTAVNDFEKNTQVGIYSDKSKSIKHVQQLDPTWDIVNQDKLFSFFKANENIGSSVRIADLKNKIAYQAYYNPWAKDFKVVKLEYPHYSPKEIACSSDTSTSGIENFKNFMRKYREPANVKPVETANENVAMLAPTILVKFSSLFNKNH